MANKRRCPSCKEYNKVEDGKLINNRLYCNIECTLAYANKNKDKGKAKLEKANRIKHKARKQALKPSSKILAEAQASFNKYIRIRDYHLSCVACGKSRQEIETAQGWKVGGAWDAGHFMTRGAKGQLRFVLFNVHKQCKSCNGGGGKFSHKAATVDANYRVNLIDKIGIEKVEYLENNNDLDLKKKDIEYLSRIKRIFNKKYRLYKAKFR